MKRGTFFLIALLYGSSMITNAQLSFITNGQTITNNNSWDIRLIDLNADSIPDAVFESKVWFNDGIGNFTKSGLYIGSGLYPSFADLNGDGFTDVLNQDSIFINDGSFHFTYSKNLVSDIAMYSSVLADIDKDGDIDIISCSDVTDRILLNDGAGNFTNTNKSLGGWGQANYAVGDMNGDGFTDIYVAIPHIPPMGGHTPNLIWQGDGAGNYTQKAHDIAGAESRAVILVDFDGDSDLDLYVSDATSWGRIFINDGTGNFTDSGQKLGSRTGDAKAADFNNDGNLDLFICQGDGNGVSGNGAPGTVWLGDGNGQFTDSEIRLQIGNTNSIAVDVSDINNDGRIDAVVANVKLDAQNGYIPMSCPVEIWINNTVISNYLDQTPPGNKAEKFAPGIVSLPKRGEYMITFSTDYNECYFSTYSSDYIVKNYLTKRINNSWTDFTETPYAATFFSTDGENFFIEEAGDILMAEDTTGGWGVPTILPSPINSSSYDDSYSETTEGVKYICSNRPGGLSKQYEIWRIDPLTNQAENLGTVINSTPRNITPYIAPDESYLIYTQSNGYYEHLYISFSKGDNGWTEPINMDRSGANINRLYQTCPKLSPDGKYLFYNSHNPDYADSSDIYWVSTGIIDTLKTIAFTSLVENPEAKNSVSFQPNPTAGLITFSFDQSSNQKSVIEIVNMQGKKILENTITSTETTLDLTNCPTGMYLVKVDTGSEIFKGKIIKN
jgi:hypothetical protein